MTGDSLCSPVVIETLVWLLVVYFGPSFHGPIFQYMMSESPFDNQFKLNAKKHLKGNKTDIYMKKISRLFRNSKIETFGIQNFFSHSIYFVSWISKNGRVKGRCMEPKIETAQENLFLKMWKSSWFSLTTLHMGRANLLFVVPIIVSAQAKQREEQNWTKKLWKRLKIERRFTLSPWKLL